MDLSDTSKEYIDDRIEARYESGYQTMNGIIIDSFTRLEKTIPDAVGSAVDVKINGKLVGIKAQVEEGKKQNEQILKTMGEVKDLLDDRAFRQKLYKLLKQIFTGIVSVGGLLLLIKQIRG